MAERPFLALLIEKFSGRRKTIIASATECPLEELNTLGEDLPIFYVLVRGKERRLINNLEMQVRPILPTREYVELTFRETRKDIGRLREINLDDVRQQNGVITIGKLGRIAFRGMDEDGRAVFSMAMSPDVDVHSKEHRRAR